MTYEEEQEINDIQNFAHYDDDEYWQDDESELLDEVCNIDLMPCTNCGACCMQENIIEINRLH